MGFIQSAASRDEASGVRRILTSDEIEALNARKGLHISRLAARSYELKGARPA
jgi:hypothetical protein